MQLAVALHDTTQVALDACTLNNALNAVQLACLIALLRWIRTGRSS